MHWVRHSAAVVLFTALTAAASHAQTREVFFADFDGPAGAPPEFSGITTLGSVEGLAGLGVDGSRFAGNLLHNRTGFSLDPGPNRSGSPTRLTLAGLPRHTSVDLNFLLAAINTWDPNDVLEVRVDGQPVFVESFSFMATDYPVYNPPPGGLLTPRDRFGDFPNRGFANGWGDQAYAMHLEPRLHNIPHTAATLTVEMFTRSGFQGAENESWGVDNFQVVLNGVPEPTGAALVLAPLAATTLLRRRRRRPSPVKGGRT